MGWGDWYGPESWPTYQWAGGYPEGTEWCRENVAETLRCFPFSVAIHFCDKGCILVPLLWGGGFGWAATVPLGGRMDLKSFPPPSPSESPLQPPLNSRDALNNRRSWFPNELKRFVVDEPIHFEMAPLRCADDSRSRTEFVHSCYVPHLGGGGAWREPVYVCGYSIENGPSRPWELTCQSYAMELRPLRVSVGVGAGYQTVIAGHGEWIRLFDQYLYGYSYNCRGMRLGHQAGGRYTIWNYLEFLEFDAHIVVSGTAIEREQIRMQNLAIERMFSDVAPVPGGMKFNRVDRSTSINQLNRFSRSWNYNAQPSGHSYTAGHLKTVTSLTGKLHNTGITLEADLVILHPQTEVHLSFIGAVDNLDSYLDYNYAKKGRPDNDDMLGAPGGARAYPDTSFHPDMRALVQVLVNVRLGARCKIPEGSEWTHPITGETGVVTFVHTDSFGYALGDLSVQWTVEDEDGNEDVRPIPSEGPVFTFDGKPFIPPINATIEFEMGPSSWPQWHNLWLSTTLGGRMDDALMESPYYYGGGSTFACMVGYAMRHNAGLDEGLLVGAKQTTFPAPPTISSAAGGHGSKAPGYYRGKVRLAPTGSMLSDNCPFGG